MALRFENVGTCLIVRQYIEQAKRLQKLKLIHQIQTLFRNDLPMGRQDNEDTTKSPNLTHANPFEFQGNSKENEFCGQFEGGPVSLPATVVENQLDLRTKKGDDNITFLAEHSSGVVCEDARPTVLPDEECEESFWRADDSTSQIEDDSTSQPHVETQHMLELVTITQLGEDASAHHHLQLGTEDCEGSQPNKTKETLFDLEYQLDEQSQASTAEC
jgi:hypothetical protein